MQCNECKLFYSLTKAYSGWLAQYFRDVQRRTHLSVLLYSRFVFTVRHKSAVAVSEHESPGLSLSPRNRKQIECCLWGYATVCGISILMI